MGSFSTEIEDIKEKQTNFRNEKYNNQSLKLNVWAQWQNGVDRERICELGNRLENQQRKYWKKKKNEHSLSDPCDGNNLTFMSLESQEEEKQG